MPRASSPEATTTTTSADASRPPSPGRAPEPESVCDLVREDALLFARPPSEPDYTAQETANANRVLEAIEPDLLACYKARVSVRPQAYGFITTDILIGPDGRVRTVDTTGGALLGDTAMNCIVRRIERATFDPPHGGGTLHVHVPFSLRRVAPGEEP